MPKTLNSFDTYYSLNKVSKKNPIVFIHGVGLNHEIWKPQVDFFKDYTTLTYDLLGHGKTPLSKAKVNFDGFYKQLLNLIDELEFKKIHLVGFSIGALIAREFASKHSERLCTLIIHGSVYKRSEEQKRIVINRWNVAKLNRPASKKAALKRWLTEDFTKKNPEIYKNIYLGNIKKKIFEAGATKIDYVKILDINKIIKPYKDKKVYKIFIAYYLGKTRLIDNIQ